MTYRSICGAACSHEPQEYRAWVRFSGPGPDWPRDIDDVGFVSCAIKLMGVPGPKLLDDEKFTQDFLSICTPTFVTPNVRRQRHLAGVDPEGQAAVLLCRSARFAHA